MFTTTDQHVKATSFKEGLNEIIESLITKTKFQSRQETVEYNDKELKDIRDEI